MAIPQEKFRALEDIEKDVATILQSAGQVLSELSKEKPVSRQVDTHIMTFIKSISKVENELAKQIMYLTQVSTGQSHEGSSYAAQKTLQMAWHRLQHARSRVNELDRIKNQHLQNRLRYQQLLSFHQASVSTSAQTHAQS